MNKEKLLKIILAIVSASSILIALSKDAITSQEALKILQSILNIFAS